MIKNVTIIGTGAYGTVLANVLTDNGVNVIMYGVDENQIDDINLNHQNSVFFKDEFINSSIKATTDIYVALERAEVVILAVPTPIIEAVCQQIIKVAKNPFYLINVAKGVDENNLDVLSKKIINDFADSKLLKGYIGLYGPSVAIEVIERKPTCVMAACSDFALATEIADLFTNEYFVVFPTTNLIGCEIAATAKNVIAIGSGIMNGLNAADNTTSSLITMGLLEIFELAKAYGAESDTFLNYASVGDLILTASSPKSRNFQFGELIAKTDSLDETLKKSNKTVEGYYNAKIIYQMLQKKRLKLPLIELIYEILYNSSRPSISMNRAFMKK